MVWIFITILIFAIGGLAYTLDVHYLAAMGILIGLILLCVLIGKGISMLTAKSESCASVFSILSIPTIIVGVLLFIVGMIKVMASEKTEGVLMWIETVVTPSSLGLIGVFLVLLGFTFGIASSEPPSK